MKTTHSTYKKDKNYAKVADAVAQILRESNVAIPVQVLIRIGKLSKEDYEDWRFGRIPYLERVVKCNLSQANRILRIIQLHAGELGLKPSQTVYCKWGKGNKVRLQFSKSGNPSIEKLYSTHYVPDSGSIQESNGVES